MPKKPQNKTKRYKHRILKTSSAVHNKEKGRTNFSHAAFVQTSLVWLFGLAVRGQSTIFDSQSPLHPQIAFFYVHMRRNQRKEKANYLTQDYVVCWFQEATIPFRNHVGFRNGKYLPHHLLYELKASSARLTASAIN